jgi:DNA polymerase-3 subunit delta'
MKKMGERKEGDALHFILHPSSFILHPSSFILHAPAVPFTAPEALNLLRAAREHGRFAHGYLITGPEGSGKRQLAGELCALLTGTGKEPLRHPDVHTIEPESKSRRIRVEQIRELEHELHMRSLLGGAKVGVIFDADRLIEGAANAFLKTLEEPPGNSHLLLVSAQPDQLLETILSRCIEIPLRPEKPREPTPLQRNWLETLATFARVERPELPHVFGLVRALEGLLAKAKETIGEGTAADLKREEQIYKQVGDTRGLEEREEYYKALTESRYLGARAGFIELLEQWWADVLRQQHGGAVELPDFSPATASLADRYTAGQVLRKTAALEQLRDSLHRTGVTEALALECGFLKAFSD